MPVRKLLILAIALAVLGAAAYLTRKPAKKVHTGGPKEGDEVLAGFDVNAVRAIEIVTPDATNGLERKEDTWTVASLFGYPADYQKLSDNLRKLALMKVGQVVPGGGDLLSEFGLDDQAKTLRLKGADGTELGTLSIGSTRESKRGGGGQFGAFPDGQYISAGDGNVLIVTDVMTAWTEKPADWIKKQLLSVPRDDVVTATVSSNGASYTLNFDEGGTTTLEGIGEDEELDSGNAGRIRGALNYMSCQSVADPSLEDTETGMDNPVTYAARGKHGTRYSLQIGGKDPGDENSRFARISVSYEEPAPPTRAEAEALVPEEVEPAAGAEAPAEGAEPAEAGPTRDERIQTKLDELVAEHNRKVEETRGKAEEFAFLGDWTYLIPTYSAGSLTLSRGEIAKTKEEEEEATEASVEDGTPTFEAVPLTVPEVEPVEIPVPVVSAEPEVSAEEEFVITPEIQAQIDAADARLPPMPPMSPAPTLSPESAAPEGGMIQQAGEAVKEAISPDPAE